MFGRGSERGFSHEVNPKVFEARSAGSGASPDPERFGLLGMRLVTPIETDTELRLDAPFIKSVTGGEAMTARDLFKYVADLEADLQDRLRLQPRAAHRRRLRGACGGGCTRSTSTVRIPEEHRAALGGHREGSSRPRRPGILNWCWTGYDEWRRHGLAAPPQVELASAMMRADQDQLGLFLSECTARGGCADPARDPLEGVPGVASRRPGTGPDWPDGLLCADGEAAGQSGQ